jgi:hypothetical protein
MATNRNHGRPQARKPRVPRDGSQPWLAERKAERARLREFQRAPGRERMERMLQGSPPDEPVRQLDLSAPDRYVVIDSAQVVLRGPFACVAEAAGEWLGRAEGEYLRAVDGEGRQRMLTGDEMGEAIRVLEAA